MTSGWRAMEMKPLMKPFLPSLLLVVVLALGACGKQPERTETRAGTSPPKAAAREPALTKVVLAQSPQPLATLSIIAYKNGFYRDEGLDVSVKEFTTGKLCFDAMLSGGAQFATVAETPIMYAGFSNQPIYVVAQICSNPRSTNVVARKDQGVQTPTDLKGKPVGTFKGGSAEYFLMEFLRKNGMTLKDVKVTYMQPPELVAAITRGDLAAISMWEPNISFAQKAIGEDKTTLFSGEGIYTETFLISMRRDYADQNEETVKKFLRALIKAEQFIKSDTTGAKAIVREALQIDKDILDKIWPHYRFEVFMEQPVIDLINKEAQFAIQSRSVADGASAPAFTSIFNKRFLDSVRAIR